MNNGQTTIPTPEVTYSTHPASGVFSPVLVVREFPSLPPQPQPAEVEQTYKAALELVARIDEDLTRKTRHYRTKAGELLTTLDEVVRAILADDLMLPEAGE